MFFLTLAFPANAANWNNSSSNETLITQNPVVALRGLGINSMALWSGGSRTNPNNADRFIQHFAPLEKFGFKHVVLVSCADWIINKNCKKDFQTLAGIIKSGKLLLDNTNLHIVIQLKSL